MRPFETLVNKQRTYFQERKTSSFEFRIKQLTKLHTMITEHEQVILDALQQDLNKSEHEAFTTEFSLVYAELRLAKRKLRKWMRPKNVRTPITHIGSKSFLLPEPYGVVALFSPWNYPLQLAITPLISAIAAGNCAILKLSEHAPSTAEILAHLCRQTFDPAYISVVLGQEHVAKSLLKEKFDYIFFTGNTTVGKQVMKQASVHLTPVTLELGGKSPVIVEQDIDVDLAAKRIVWGKFTNAGQTCVAPDYVVVHSSMYEVLLRAMREQIDALYTTDPLTNETYARIIHENHFNRLKSMLTSGTIYSGGRIDRDTLKIEPTIMTDIDDHSVLMQEEIFGPILPVLPYNDLETVIDNLQQKEKPLALYVFSTNNIHIAYIQKHLSFGGGCINDTLYHVANTHLPFGGVGASGMGAYHGQSGFETFSHMKSMVRQTTRFDLPFRYPSGKRWLSYMKKIFK